MSSGVVDARKIVDNGPGASRWDLVILGDGYRSDELKKYESDVDQVVAAIFATPPFDSLRRAINVHRIDVASEESGAGDLCRGVRRATFFESNFCSFNIDRLLVGNAARAQLVAEDHVPEVNATLLMVNSTTYGGSGGAVPVFSLAPNAYRIALHEMGHSHFGLADEYAMLSDCRNEPERARYSGPEPSQPNVTARLEPLKWADAVTPGVTIPTTRNADCSDCDRQPNPAGADAVGAFEGAHKYRCGIYRPQYDCMMRNLDAPFCAVCAKTIRRVLGPYLPPTGRRRAVRSS